MLGVPLVESVTLASAGYLTTVQQTAQHGDFRPLVAWLAAHSGIDGAFRLFEALPFLLAVTLPGTLRRILGSESSINGRVMAIAGQFGFALYLLAIIMGIISSKSAASSFASATTAAQQQAAADSFASAFGAQNVVSHVGGGMLLVLFLALFCIRNLRTNQLPLLLTFLGMVTGVLLLLTAVQFLAQPAQIEASTSALSFASLALWLLLAGIVLVRLPATGRILATAPTAPPTTTTPPTSTDNIDAAHASAPSSQE
ncbi:MAG: hypothetical protein OJF49_000079 [Ktedonobacterales bacterium]|nr:MAG: hypothetical protein OJF49_000079 [Ktedonobacterales bacterium]